MSDYEPIADLYDVLLSGKDYETEAARLSGVLASLGVRPGARVLEAACGTGGHIAWLRGAYEMHGFDRSERMIAIAKEKLPGVDFFVGDMTNVAATGFDAILCLYGSIGHVHPIDRLRATAAAFARAVRSGGALVIEPWLAPESFVPGERYLEVVETPAVKLCRASIGALEGELSVFDYHWLVLKRGAKEVEHRRSTERVWLCPRETLAQVFRAAGFDCRFEQGVLIGRRA